MDEKAFGEYRDFLSTSLSVSFRPWMFMNFDTNTQNKIHNTSTRSLGPPPHPLIPLRDLVQNYYKEYDIAR